MKHIVLLFILTLNIFATSIPTTQETLQPHSLYSQKECKDRESGLYYNRFRYYDPEAAQYISPDPIGLEGGIALQGYVHNPNGLVDPLGLAGCGGGAYNDIKGTVPGLDAHHVGQQAVMKKLVPGYDAGTAPSILVPKVGHTIKGPRGIVSRSTKGFDNARQVIARDVRELWRVYPDAPNSQPASLAYQSEQTDVSICNVKVR